MKVLAGSGGTRLFWGAAFMLGMFGMAGLLSRGLVPDGWAIAAMLAPMLLLIPFVRAQEAHQRDRGASSPAQRRYNRRFMVASFAYVGAMGVAMSVWNTARLGDAVAVLVALLPALPVLAMIAIMLRYLVEENDEYLRHRTVTAAMIALGGVLALASVWGFLETFGLVPHVWTWWVFPAWAALLGLAQCGIGVRQRWNGEA